ncbi:hypothetical protein COLO4_05535 [Corchorus olitorius]|uniref:Uncharacterized protein n=1 Tax=Corchorus olitorius TaxID=93759 RepID=A0A1R3KQK0_9ROSI|nr:hypothetical protein COLO4_05535 [Corchorus olitorius]
MAFSSECDPFTVDMDYKGKGFFTMYMKLTRRTGKPFPGRNI